MYVFELLLFIYFAYVSTYSFSLSIAGMFYRAPRRRQATLQRKFAVLIPAYKEDAVIASVASNALRQAYPQEKYDVVVIADSLKPSTIETLKAMPIVLVEVAFETSTKVKALNTAMSVIGDRYDVAVVLDADNLMEPEFLTRMNDLFDMGYQAIQGKRDPKNDNTPMALLDGLSETINNFIYRQGTVAMGMSASLNGSGMAFAYPIYKEILSGMDSIGGFDRELELKLLERGIKVYFAKDVVVFDEKVPNTEVFEKQRKRWISSQFFYLKKYFGAGWSGLFRGDFSFFNSAVLRNIQLPRLLNLGLLTVLTAVGFILREHLSFTPFLWLILLALSVVSMVIAIPGKLYTRKLLKAVLLLPAIFVKMFLLLFRLRGANKTFIHTPHGHVETQPSNLDKL